jgi:UDP-N-acetylglucosamine--N-acetylmuramyl-(pentapeptide) pyrophosphoryl-undecaprenol N-acetylglucosamine transferase
MTAPPARSILVTAGGTGGHVFPALAVARELRDRGVAVTWLGTRRGIEAELVPANGFPIEFIEVSGFRGKGMAAKLAAPVQILRALGQALTILRRVRPQAVLGLGGFASGPGGLAARLLGVPLVIHEQNAVAGTTNRILAKIARRVLEAFADTLPNGEHCGNPVRREISSLPDPVTRQVGEHQPARLLVLGGSLGALAINRMEPQALALMDPARRPLVIHQCGRRHQAVTEEAYREAGVEAEIKPFVDDMAAAYGWADLVLCRSGALTVAELACAGVGSLLVPFPHAIDDHQTRNGEWLVLQGAARLVQERDLNPKLLSEQLTELINDGSQLQAMAVSARGRCMANATATVANVCEEVMG